MTPLAKKVGALRLSALGRICQRAEKIGWKMVKVRGKEVLA